MFSAYYELCKPRVVALMLVTAAVGMQLATPHGFPFYTMIIGNLGIGLVAAAAAVINHIADHKVDKHMMRTEQRPLPTGRLTNKQALWFAVVLLISGELMLLFFINGLTALLTFLTLVGYAGVYTFYLKHAT